MTAVLLYDALARSGRAASGTSAELAEQMARSALEDLRRYEDYERRYGGVSGGTGEAELSLLRSVWQLFDGWARDAVQVLERVRECIGRGEAVASGEALEDAYGRVRARLGVTPEQILRGLQQIRDGKGIAGKELRDELRARLRA